MVNAIRAHSPPKENSRCLALLDLLTLCVWPLAVRIAPPYVVQKCSGFEIWPMEASEYEWRRKLGEGKHGNINLAYCTALFWSAKNCIV
jgi:hypothetical protein